MSDKGHFGKVNDQYTGYIYVTTNEINKKWYIGSCWCKNMDRTGYLGSGTLLKLALKKYGRANFTQEVLFYYTDHDPFGLKDIETEILTEIDAASNPQSYNLKNYGFGLPWGENKNAPPEVVEKWSKNNYWRNNPISENTFLRLQQGREEFARSRRGKEFYKKNGVHLLNFQKSDKWQSCVERFKSFTRSNRSNRHKTNISKALSGRKQTAEHIKNHSKSLIEGGKLRAEKNPRARDCVRLDTLEVFGTVTDLVENLNADLNLHLNAKLGGVWDALNRSDNGGFYKKKVWLTFTSKRNSTNFSLLTSDRKTRRKKVLSLLKSGKSISEIKAATSCSYKLIAAVRNEHNFNYQPHRGHLSDLEKKLIKEKWKQGANDGEIAEEIVGVTRRMVNQVRQKNNLPARKKLSARKILQIAKRIESQEADANIMETLKVGRKSILKVKLLLQSDPNLLMFKESNFLSY